MAGLGILFFSFFPLSKYSLRPEEVLGRNGNFFEAPRDPGTAKHFFFQALGVRHEYEYCDVCVSRSDDNMLDVCFQESQLTSDPMTTPQQCNKEDRQRCQSS